MRSKWQPDRLRCSRGERASSPLVISRGASAGVWARRLIILLSLGTLIALPAIWVSSQYFEKDVAAPLSYMARDGWCEVGVSPNAGIHCFGDYASQALTAEHDFGIGDRDFTKGPYPSDPKAAYNSLYPPIGQFPHVVSDLLREGFAGRQPAFYAYFAFLLLAVLSPAIWLGWLWRRSALLLIPLVVIGIATLPVIAVLDRANSAGFIVPLLLAFVLFLRRDPPWLSPAMAVGAALIRPQFALLLLALLALGRWRSAVASAFAIVGITVVSFALTAGGLVPSLSSWWTNLTQFQGGTGDIRLPAPANISMARSVVGVAQWVQNVPGPLGSIGDWLVPAIYRYPLIPTACLVVVTAVVFSLCRRTIPRSVVIVIPLALAAMASTVSPAYYLTFALVIAAMIMGAMVVGARPPGMLDCREERTPWFWGWPLVIAIAFSLAPLPFARDALPDAPVPRSAIILENIGKAWLVVVLIGLVWAALRAWRARSAVSPAARPPAP